MAEFLGLTVGYFKIFSPIKFLFYFGETPYMVLQVNQKNSIVKRFSGDN